MPGPLLIVDDEPGCLASLRQVLAAHYPLVFARSGPEALVATRKHQPALILLDVLMPDMDGFAVCRHLKTDPATENIPVIFVSALADVGDETAGFAMGAVDYIIKPVSPPVVLARVQTHLSLVRAQLLEESYHDAIYMLGEASRSKDTDTGAHIWRMAGYSSALAAAIGWAPEACRQLELAAPMHDIGKLSIPDAILHKPAALDAEEWRLMQTHASAGHAILSQSRAPLLQMAAQIALCHHERWDGSGYPEGLQGEAIPESARIVAIADVFDALSVDRPYKQAWPMHKVLAAVEQEAGRHFEPRLVDHFLRIQPTIQRVRARWHSASAMARQAESLASAP